MGSIASGLQDTFQRIDAAARAAGRDPRAIRLLAVSKTFPTTAIRSAYAAGQRAFGENYVQEAVAKMDELAGLPGLEWHLIGPLQANKTKVVAERFDWVHTVDREKIAQRLSAARPSAMAPLQVCVQVNISGEATKTGVEPVQALALAATVARCERLTLRGFMGIAEPTDDVALQRREFAVLRELLGSAQRQGLAVDTLSMGMTADLESAIAEGATIVRVGTAIFGPRATTAAA